MGADASIYSLIRPQQAQPGPLDQYAQGLQLRGLIDDQGLKQLQRQQLEKGIRDDEATAEAYRQSQGDPVKLREMLYGKGQYKAAIAAEKAGLETEKMRGDIGKTKAETHKMNIASLRDRLAAVADDNQLAAAREEAMRLYGPQAVQSMPQTVNDPNFPTWREQQLMTADKLLERTAPKFSVEDFGGSKGVVQSNPLAAGGVSGLIPKTATPGEVMTDKRGQESNRISAGQLGVSRERLAFEQSQPRGQYDSERGLLVDPRSGVATPVTQGGVPLGAKDKPLTESQGKASGLALRAQAAHDILKTLEDAGTKTPGILKMGADSLPVIGGAAGMAVNSLPTWAGGPNSNQQKVEQAQRDFVNAALRVESGASISPSEFENARKQYFPQPGDSAAVIEQKRQNREAEIESLKIQGGPGAKNVKSTYTPPPQTSGGKIGGVLTQNADGSFNYGAPR